MAEARELLRRRGDVSERDIDDIIGIAAELQQAERDRASAPTVEDVQRVASELDIEPGYVQQAIEVLARRRASEAERKRQEEAARAQILARARNVLLGGALTLLLALLVAAGLGGVGVSPVLGAQAQLQSSERALVAVLDRQEQLVPSLVALAGGELRLPEVADDASIEERLAASEALARALAEALAALPADTATEQTRLNLQHEISGSANRIAVERRRWEQARAERQAASRTLTGRLAELFWL